MSLPHPERHRWVKVISGINKQINAPEKPRAQEPPPFAPKGSGGFAWTAPD